MKKLIIGILVALLVVDVVWFALNLMNSSKENGSEQMATEEAASGSQEDEATSQADAESSQDAAGQADDQLTYFTANDYYNMKSNSHLTIISNFETYQQTTSYTCGPSSAYMVLNYYDSEAAKTYDEMKIAELCGSTGGGVGTSSEQMANFFQNELGWEVEYHMSHDKKFTSCEDFINILVKWNLEEGTPIMVDWCISSGHWETIIGYDDMGTSDINDDVLIFADSSDSGDQNCDGYMVFSAARFFRMWKESTPFDGQEVYKQQYLIAKPAK